jgi:predicted ArsR family transcriptional regulator
MPDPRLAAQRWSDALQRGDAEVVYSLLSQSAREALGREGVRQLLDRDRKELVAAAAAATGPNARVETLARVSYSDARSALVVLEDGAFRVAAAAALPAHAASPEAALQELREVLARRSFAGLIRVLTADAGQVLDAHLASVVEALGDPATVEIEIDGRRATARLPGGHTVKLEREDGAWRVRDFD